MEIRDAFEILSVSPESTDDDVRNAYIRLKSVHSLNSEAGYSLFTGDESREELEKIERAFDLIKNRRYSLKTMPQHSDAIRVPLKSSFVCEASKLAKEKFLEIKDLRGATFKEIRESCQISLEEVSEITKVAVDKLDAIESESFEHLPAKVFLKGFVKSYVQALGVENADTYASYYMNHYSD